MTRTTRTHAAPALRKTKSNFTALHECPVHALKEGNLLHMSCMNKVLSLAWGEILPRNWFEAPGTHAMKFSMHCDLQTWIGISKILVKVSLNRVRGSYERRGLTSWSSSASLTSYVCFRRCADLAACRASDQSASRNTPYQTAVAMKMPTITPLRILVPAGKSRRNQVKPAFHNS